MSAISNELMERIRRVKAMTGSTNENEAAVAASMLASMLHEHDLKLSDVETIADKREQIVENNWSDKYQDWKGVLAMTVAQVMFCRVLRQRLSGSGSRTQWKLTFVGHETDVEVAVYTFSALCTKIDSLAKVRTSEYAARLRAEAKQGSIAGNIYTVRGYANPFVFKRSWLSGAVEVICLALQNQYQTFRANSLKGNELVVTKDKLVTDYYRRAYPKLQHRRVRMDMRNSEGYSQGRSDGATIKAYRGVGGRASGTLALGNGM